MDLFESTCRPPGSVSLAAVGALGLFAALLNLAVALWVSPAVAMHPMLTLVGAIGGATALTAATNGARADMVSELLPRAVRRVCAGLLVLIALRLGGDWAASATVAGFVTTVAEGVIGPYGVWPLGVGAAGLLVALLPAPRRGGLAVACALMCIGMTALASTAPVTGRALARVAPTGMLIGQVGAPGFMPGGALVWEELDRRRPLAPAHSRLLEQRIALQRRRGLGSLMHRTAGWATAAAPQSSALAGLDAPR